MGWAARTGVPSPGPGLIPATHAAVATRGYTVDTMWMPHSPSPLVRLLTARCSCLQAAVGCCESGALGRPKSEAASFSQRRNLSGPAAFAEHEVKQLDSSPRRRGCMNIPTCRILPLPLVMIGRGQPNGLCARRGLGGHFVTPRPRHSGPRVMGWGSGQAVGDYAGGFVAPVG